MKATWTCLNCEEVHQQDVLFRCEMCEDQICPICFLDHTAICFDDQINRCAEDEHLGQLGRER